MQFTVVCSSPVKPLRLPKKLNKIPKLIPNHANRTLTLFEVMGDNGPLEVLLDGQKWSAPISELPLVGSTEKWEIVNLTGDTHPIHLHLVQFQISSRQAFRAEDYMQKWIEINGEPPLDHPTEVLPVCDYLEGSPIPPDANEAGWKDTIRANPGEVTTILIRFAPQDADPDLAKPGMNLFPFNPSSGPGYVWHCHIIDHEDNEMMRPYKVISNNDMMEPNMEITTTSKNQCITVYSTKTGNKYHVEGCSSLSKSKIPISLNDAKSAGLTPCKCHPPSEGEYIPKKKEIEELTKLFVAVML